MNIRTHWVIQMVACGHKFEAVFLPTTTHQRQKIRCRVFNCRHFGYWKFI